MKERLITEILNEMSLVLEEGSLVILKETLCLKLHDYVIQKASAELKVINESWVRWLQEFHL